MPPRPDLLTKRWSTLDLPVLPFLAPRAFTPWPSFGRRATSGALTAQSYDIEEHDNDTDLQNFHKTGSPLVESRIVTRRLGVSGCRKSEHRRGKDVRDVSATWGALAENGKLDSTNAGVERVSIKALSGSSDDLFHQRYEQVRSKSLTEGPASFAPGRKRSFTTQGTRHSQADDQEVETVIDSSEQKVLVDHHMGLAQNNAKLDHCERLQSASPKEFSARSPSGARLIATDLQLQQRVELERGSTIPKAFKRANRIHPRVRNGPRASIKFVRWPHDHTSTSVFVWQKRIAVLVNRLEGVPTRSNGMKCLTNPSLHERLFEIESSISLRKAWDSLPVEERQQNWPDLMLEALDRHPTKVLKLLVATLVEPYPPSYAISDTLNYVITFYLGHGKARSSKIALEILRVFQQLLHTVPAGHLQLEQKSIYLLLKNLDAFYSRVFFQELTQAGHALTTNTLLHFPSEMRLSTGPDERMDILKKIWQAGSDFESLEVKRVCATLLQRKHRVSESGYSDTEIFEFMLECGLKPNLIFYNILLQNSLEANDHETAWQIHDMMVENNVKTDAYTYSLLLNDAKIRRDRESIKRILGIVGETGINNVHLATDFLHAIFILRVKKSSHSQDEGRITWSDTFERMLTVYRQYFRSEPLAHIVPWFNVMYPNHTIAASGELEPAPNKSLMEPSVPTLIVMITALLRERNEPDLVIQIYNHFWALIRAGDAIALLLARSTRIFNIILLALGKYKENLTWCPRLIEHMLSSNTDCHLGTVDSQPTSKTATTSEAFAKSQRLHPMPDVFTWSILLKIFLDHAQPRAAEKVLSMMEERKVYPNQVTWNTLIMGHARMQDMAMTVRSFRRLTRNGFEMDGGTMKGLSYLQNRRALIEAMKASESEDQNAAQSQRWPLKNLNRTLKLVRDNTIDDQLLQEGPIVEGDDEPVDEEAIEFSVGDIPPEENE